MNLRRMLADLKVYGRGYVRSRFGIFFTLIFPVVLILLFGAIFAGGSSGPIGVYIQNQDGTTPVTTAFINALNSTKSITLVSVDPSKDFSQYLLKHSSSDGIIIPQGFTQQYTLGNHVNVTLYGNPASTTSAIVAGITGGIVNAFNLKHANGTSVIGINRLTVTSTSYKYIDFLVPGLIGFSILTSPMFALVNVSSQYKRDKIFKQLSLTPLTKTEWLTSKIIWYFAMTILSFLLMVGTGVYLFGAHIALSYELIPFLFLGPFMFVSLGMLVGTVSTSVEAAGVVANLVTFPMMFLSGTFFPVSSFPTYLQTVAHFLPLYYVIDGLTNTMIYSNFPPANYDLAVMLVVSLVFFGLAVRLFKWRED